MLVISYKQQRTLHAIGVDAFRTRIGEHWRQDLAGLSGRVPADQRSRILDAIMRSIATAPEVPEAQLALRADLWLAEAARRADRAGP